MDAIYELHLNVGLEALLTMVATERKSPAAPRNQALSAVLRL